MDTMGNKNLDFLLSEAQSNRSRDGVVVTSGAGVCPSGMVMAYGAATNAAATASTINGTGNATISAVTISGNVAAGAHILKADDADTLTLYSPAGTELGSGNTGAARTIGGMTFTVTAGTTAMEAGDYFTITVTESEMNVVPYDAGTHAGVAGVLAYNTDATSADQKGVIFARDCEVDGSMLAWDADNTAAEKTAAVALLLAKGIVAR